MRTSLLSLLAAGLLGAAACQSPQTTQQAPDPQHTPGSPKVASEAAAKAAVAQHISQLPNRQLFVLDSAHVVDAGPNYQVMVPRSDWAGRMPNEAAFDVDKVSGAVTTLAVR